MFQRPTQKELRDAFEYDPERGVLIWRISPSNSVKIGSVAGCALTNGYVKVKVKGKPYQAHRLIWLHVTGYYPKPNEIDHSNRVPGDNSWSNLKLIVPSEQYKNRSVMRNSKTGVSGVVWNKTHKHWQAEIGSGQRYEHLGNFRDFFEAVCARKSAAALRGYK